MTGERIIASQWNTPTKAKRKALTNSTELERIVFPLRSSVSLKNKIKVTQKSKITPNMRTFIIDQCYRSRLLLPFSFNGWHERRLFKERSNYSPPSRMRSLFVTSVIVLAEYLSPHLVFFFSVSKLKACYAAYFLLYFPLIGIFLIKGIEIEVPNVAFPSSMCFLTPNLQWNRSADRVVLVRRFVFLVVTINSYIRKTETGKCYLNQDWQ